MSPAAERRPVLVAGSGYVGSALARRLAADGAPVVGVRRSADQAALAAAAEGGWALVAADLTDSGALDALPDAPRAVVYAVGSDARTPEAYRAAYVDGLRTLLDRYEGSDDGAPWLFTSSTSVVDTDDGRWVDELTPAAPTAATAAVLRSAEALLLARRPGRAAVARLGGIYGPGRCRLVAAARSGTATYAPGSAEWTNRIHRDDAAGALACLLERHARGGALPPVVHVTDGAPVRRRDFLRWLAARTGGPPPRPAPSPTASHGKRCSAALLGALGFRPRYADAFAGYAELAPLGAAPLGDAV